MWEWGLKKHMRVSQKLLGFFTFHNHKQPLVIYCHLFLVAISYNRLKLEYSENIDNFLSGNLDNLRSWVVFLCFRPSVSGFKFTVSHVFKTCGNCKANQSMVDTPPENQHKGVEPKIWEKTQIIHFNRVFDYKPSILGYPYFWKHP